MMDGGRGVQRTYLLLTLLTTLAASFIWGINTLFLLDAGLDNTEAFAANAFFTLGQVIFEVPTGVVADTRGRRFSFMLGAGTLLVSTLLYLVMWNLHAPLWGWALASILLGLGFTFFSGATEAWLVDALAATGFTGNLESVFGRAQIVSGGGDAGWIGGGRRHRAADQPWRAVRRSGRDAWRHAGRGLVAHARPRLHTRTRSQPDRGSSHRALGRGRRGAPQPPVRWLMLAAPFTVGVGFYAFYAFQPYLLELYGDPTAYSIAGLAAAIVAAAQIFGGLIVACVRRLFKRRTDALILGGVLSVVLMALIGLTTSFVVALALLTLWCLMLRRGDPDASGVHQRPHPVTTARDRPLVRRPDRILRWRRRAARARADRGRLRLRHLVRGRGRDPAACRAIRRPGPPRERAVRPNHRVAGTTGGGGGLARALSILGPPVRR